MQNGFILAEGVTHVVKGSQRVAFTLAEVLITLGVIGVVAALTMPTLVAHYKAKVLETQFKRSYSVLYNATKMLVQQDILPYELTQEERLVQYSKVLNAASYNNPPGYSTLSGKSGAHYFITRPAMALSDGSLAMISRYNWIMVDINGAKNGPNRVGVDMHVFIITPDNNLRAMVVGDHDSRECVHNPESTDMYFGFGCTQYALLNKNPDGAGDYWYNFLGK